MGDQVGVIGMVGVQVIVIDLDCVVGDVVVFQCVGFCEYWCVGGQGYLVGIEEVVVVDLDVGWVGNDYFGVLFGYFYIVVELVGWIIYFIEDYFCIVGGELWVVLYLVFQLCLYLVVGVVEYDVIVVYVEL